MVKLSNGWELRKRQEECHDKMIKAFKNGQKEFLLAANCRFGKTITTLSALNDLADNNQLIMVISTMSVKNEWGDNAEKVGYDLSLLDQEINDIDFDSLSLSGKHIIYCSTQKLGNDSKQSEALIKWFNRHEGLKTIVYDECHLGSGTERTLNVLDRLDFDNKVYLSGTPYRKHLKKEFGMDKVEGEEKIYLYTLVDEREDYKNNIITDYVPVQLIMQVLDYSAKIDELTDSLTSDKDKESIAKYGVSSTYFKKIFSESEYKNYAYEFLDRILAFAAEKHIANFLFFVPLRKVGNDIVKHFANYYKDKIEFRNLCGDYVSDDTTESEDELQLESESEKLSAFYKTDSNKIKIGITCNKCGTGTTLRGLDAVAFLKDTTQAIPFIQKSQRVRTPEAGKTVGYCLCFNQWQGLKAFCDFSRTAANDTNDESSTKDAVNKMINNGAVKLVLDMTEIEDYSEIIDIMNTYKPGQYPLFDEFNFDIWPDDTFVFLTTLQAYKKELLSKHKELRDDPDVIGAETAEQLAKALRKHDMETEARNCEMTREEMCELLELNFVNSISMFYDFGWSKEAAADYENYSEQTWNWIITNFGTKDVWKYILKTYPRYISMIYNYLDQNNN